MARSPRDGRPLLRALAGSAGDAAADATESRLLRGLPRFLGRCCSSTSGSGASGCGCDASSAT